MTIGAPGYTAPLSCHSEDRERVSLSGSDWRGMMRRHWKAFAAFAAAGALACIGAVLVFLWFVGNAQSSGMVPRTLGLWTFGNIVSFLLNAAFWELLLIGLPAILAAIAGWLWWRRLAEGERWGSFGKTSRSTSGGGGLSLLLFIAFCIKVYLDGKWNVAIGTFTVDYVVGSFVTILLWTAVIFGIPAVVALVWWLRRS